MIKFFCKKGQNTAEYAIVFALVITAVMAMQAYVRRGLQRGIKYQVDDALNDSSETFQYEPYYLRSTTISTTEYDSDAADVVEAKTHGQLKTDLAKRKTHRTGTEVIDEIE